jgi:F-type H+-transporting ATPase subunit a
MTFALLLGLLLAGAPEPSPTVAPTPAQEKKTVGEAAREAVETGSHEAVRGLEGHPAEGEEGEEGDVASIILHHVTDEQMGHLEIGPFDLGPTRHLLYFAGAGLLVLALLRVAIYSYAHNRVPRGFGAFVEILLVLIRDEIAEKNIPHEGRRYTPLLASFFFFIFISALVGLLPFQSTATGNFSVTAGLAVVSFAATQWAGIRKYGVVRHFTGMVPHGLPLFVLPIMILVEVIAMIVRPAALTIRLFANMIAGHMVITTLLLLIPMLAGVSKVLGIIIIPVSLALALFIMFLEILVAFLQAFIFTLLSSIFIGMAAHPAH